MKSYCKSNLRELRKLQIHNLNFDHKNGNPVDFLVKVQIKARKPYPDPVFSPILPADPPNNQAGIDRVENAEDANQATLDNPVNKRNMGIVIFRNAMPNSIRR